MGITKKILTVLMPKAPWMGDTPDSIWIDTPWCCATCGIQFEKYEDMRFKDTSCGCKYEVCENCNKNDHKH